MEKPQKSKELQKSNWAEKEEEILSFWNENKIFEKTLEKNKGKKNFVFYDGPPFATGLPHYGHLLASVIKDAIPRYQTMKGRYVRRKWGWDCHGLPIETLIEKDLGLEHKKDIEEYGIDKFNSAAKDSVFKYDKEWKKVIPRIGRWIDMEGGYKTMDSSYTESIWWGFKELYDKGLVYKGYKSMHICPRCETTLSTTEVADGYKDITDISVTAKFELVDEPGTFVLAWTTTPWTLPGNVALAVGDDIEYVKVLVEKGPTLGSPQDGGRSDLEEQVLYIVAKERVQDVFSEKEYEVKEINTERLVLSPYKREDAGSIFDLLRDESELFYKDIDIDKPENVKDVKDLYESSKNQAQWSIFYENKLTGVIEFDKEGKLRYWIGTQNQKKGLMSEVLLAVSRYLFYSGVFIISARVTSNNSASKKALEKAEFYFAKKQEYAPDDIVFTYEILNKGKVEILKGKDLVGKQYKPVFDYYSKDEQLENRENGWKIYSADFVTTESGTGVVHIAPAFGEDDMNLGKKYNLPFVHHVTFDGRFKDEVKDFAGQYVKPKDDNQATDIEIIKHLAHKGLLFSKLKIKHSYPHCWRCDTPLLNYATSSWFIKVTELKDKLISLNKKVNWVPESIGEGRFGNWLENARDWSISRTRFWGAPLPVWECDKCEERVVIGSLDDIKNKNEKRNNFFVMRHGEAENNTGNIVSSKTGEGHHVTEKGKKQIQDSAKELKEKNIDIIISSPFLRTKETAQLVAQELGLNENDIVFDERIKETNTGDFDGKTVRQYHDFFSSYEEMFTKTPQNGENLMDLKRRVMDFVSDVNIKYSGKNVLIVTHEYPSWFLFAGSKGLNIKQSIEIKEERGDDFLKNAEVEELDFVPFPHNENWELDLHRPYIDDVVFPCACGEDMKRVLDVFDCWVESGSMSFAQFHYPFENKKEFEDNFPADFIAEGIDQTRGWFYTSLVINAGLFDKAPYENVVVNGLIMAEDGKKMSKRLKNYPETWDVLNKYSADALRYYMLSSPVVHGEELCFSERGVDEVQKKVIGRTNNVLSFYKLYEDRNVLGDGESKNVLDEWIIARLYQMTGEIEESLDKYELDRAVRPIGLFVDDLSTWYLRRSRGRFKGEDVKDKEDALATLRFVLTEFAKAIAPIMPFLAENIYRDVGGSKESVHLEDWVRVGAVNKKILEDMEDVRKIVSLGLEARASAGIKVRQPLQKLNVKSEKLKDELSALVKDEVNVKEVLFDSAMGEEVELDIEITPELKKEGQFRELVRFIQDMRKKEKFTPSDLAIINIKTDDSGKTLVEEFMNELKSATPVKSVEFGDVSDGVEIKIDDMEFSVSISR